MYYNNSNINENDGLVVHISDYITETRKIININIIKVINTKILIENNREIIISAIMGDFNFDISNHDTLNQEFLHALLENGYCRLLQASNITRPSDKTFNSGTCIGNNFI